MTQLKQYPHSVIEQDGTTYALARDGRDKKLCVQGDATGFSGDIANGMLLCPLTAENAAALRRRLSWLNPVPLGVETSFGFGDRLGAATPGHIRSVEGTGIAPIFA
ncbi:MAG: tagaturonate epimerase family protein, partial [Caldilineaceae bacterium]|nr:tagaturonate epimerase family protein [Caldilineaceae bacterium]